MDDILNQIVRAIASGRNRQTSIGAVVQALTGGPDPKQQHYDQWLRSDGQDAWDGFTQMQGTKPRFTPMMPTGEPDPRQQHYDQWLRSDGQDAWDVFQGMQGKSRTPPMAPTPQMPQDPSQRQMSWDQYLRSDGQDAWQEFELMQQTGDLQPPGAYPWREGKMDNSSFDDAGSYRTADMSGIDPAGVGEQANLQKQARAFQSLMSGLDDYEKLFSEVGGSGFDRVLPGSKNDALSTAHRNLQMQMKELYNLGVLNGPDLDLMNEILLDPTSVGGNLLGAVGIGNMNERIPANIARVRTMMKQLAEPGLQQLGIEPERLMPQQKRDLSTLSDEELKQMLLGGS